MNFDQLSVVTHPKIDSVWSQQDFLGALRVRLSLGRNSYRVNPGLYKFGNPQKESEVLVTSNYKLTFDKLRRAIKGMDVWILVLETYGVNVWCAAGKGTFGSVELIRQIKETQLHLYSSQKRIILPQLGAPGVSAQEVKKATGFNVKYGPVKAEDISEYLNSDLKKTKKLRSVQFNFTDRLVLTPVEIVNSLRYLLYAAIAVFILSGISSTGYSLAAVWQNGLKANTYLFSAYLTGAFITPILLPWIPFTYFAGKGILSGFLTFLLLQFINSEQIFSIFSLGWFLISGAVSSFLAMNFTGASTFTSLSGVKKEMRIFVPIQIALILLGLIAIAISKFI